MSEVKGTGLVHTLEASEALVSSTLAVAGLQELSQQPWRDSRTLQGSVITLSFAVASVGSYQPLLLAMNTGQFQSFTIPKN